MSAAPLISFMASMMSAREGKPEGDRHYREI